jgi:integrase
MVYSNPVYHKTTTQPLPATQQGRISAGHTAGNPSRLLLGDFLVNWLAVKQSAIRLKTHQDYHRLVHKYILPTLGHLPITELSTYQLSLFYLDLHNHGLGSRTVRYVHSILRVALKDAVQQGLMEANPTDGAILPRWNKREMQVLDEEQVGRFLHAAKASPYYGVYHFAIATGMRMGELLGLKWADVDWGNAILFIRRQAQRVNGHGVIFQEPKTKSGIRKIKIQKNSLGELEQQRQRIQRLIKRTGGKWQEHDLIFPSLVGTTIVASNLRRNFKANLRKANLPNIRFHDLRHTAATLMINHEVPIPVVSQILGHSKPSVTLDIYAHCSVAMQTHASLIMDEIVGI